MIDRTPYTYFIKWSEHNIGYYGRRTAKGCNPNELFRFYYTSSRYVKEFIAQHGLPDIIQVRRTFETIEECCAWEYRVLKKLKCYDNEKLLNVHPGGKDFSYGVTGPKTDKHRENIRKARARIMSDPNYVHPCKGVRGTKKPPRSKEHREKLSKASMGNKHGSFKRSEATKEKLRKPKPKNVCRIHDRKEMHISHFNQWLIRTY